MTGQLNKTLLFIKSPDQKLSAIENFLKKRNYQIYIESDLNESLTKIEETEPGFVFIAWDHKDPNITNLPKMIGQFSNTQIILYSQSSTKESIRRLNYINYPYKLFPPISGPAIERLVNKLIKDSIEILEAEEKNKKTSNQNRLQKDEGVQAKSSLDNDTDNVAFSTNKLIKTSNEILNKIESLKTRNTQLSKSTKKKLSNDKKKLLKKDFDEHVKSDIQDMLNTFQEDDINLSHTEINKIDKPKQLPNMSIIKNAGPSSAFNFTKTIEPAKGYQIKVNESEELFRNHQIHCLLVQSDTWCGYLITYSDIEISHTEIDNIFTNWISQHFENLYETEESDYFDLEIKIDNFRSWAKRKSEYFEVVEADQSELVVCFMSINPAEMIVIVDEANNLIEVGVEKIPIDKELLLELKLHLPENNKFLLYTPVKGILTENQKKRLIEKSVEKLFTPTEFEKEYKKMIAEGQLEILLSDIKKDTSNE